MTADRRPWVAQQLDRFTYKPGWRFEYFNALGEDYVSIMMEVPDSRGKTQPVRPYRVGFDGQLVTEPLTVKVGGRHPVPDVIVDRCDEGGFAHWLLMMIDLMESHEIREWFRLDGELYDDPHANDPR